MERNSKNSSRSNSSRLITSSPHVIKRKIKDPFLGLTSREKGEMGSNWNVFKKDLTGNAHLIFSTFFTRYPDYMKLFGAFSKSNVDAVKSDPRLQAHANSVMYFFSAIIDNMNDPECLTMMLHKTGRNHKRDNVPLESFYHFKGILLEVMQMQLGNKLTPLAAGAWDKTLNIIIGVVVTGMGTTSSGTVLPVVVDEDEEETK